MLYDLRQKDVSDVEINLDQTRFFGDVAVRLAAELEETIGGIESAALVAQVGDQLGTALSDSYAEALGGLPESPQLLAEILVDLQDRINGRFSIESATEEKIVLVNAQCPFSRRVEGHPSLCMVTTNVFGRIVADSRGYASVDIQHSIATGHGACRVVIHLREGRPDRGADHGHDFFR